MSLDSTDHDSYSEMLASMNAAVICRVVFCKAALASAEPLDRLEYVEAKLVSEAADRDSAEVPFSVPRLVLRNVEPYGHLLGCVINVPIDHDIQIGKFVREQCFLILCQQHPEMLHYKSLQYLHKYQPPWRHLDATLRILMLALSILPWLREPVTQAIPGMLMLVIMILASLTQPFTSSEANTSALIIYTALAMAFGMVALSEAMLPWSSPMVTMWCCLAVPGVKFVHSIATPIVPHLRTRSKDMILDYELMLHTYHCTPECQRASMLIAVPVDCATTPEDSQCHVVRNWLGLVQSWHSPSDDRLHLDRGAPVVVLQRWGAFAEIDSEFGRGWAPYSALKIGIPTNVVGRSIELARR